MKQSGEIATPYGLAMTGQYGRSMVEMLGVLAVIGILSVVGIAGFKNAMDKNKANTIINEAQKRTTLVVPQIQLQNNANPTLNEFSNNNLGYAEFDTKVYTKADNLPNGQFGIKVSGVGKEICQNILNTLGVDTVIRRLSTTDAPTTALTTCGETNTFLMVYNNDMTTNPVAGEFSDKNSCTDAGFVYNNGQCANDMCDTCTTGQDCLTVAGEKKCVSACPSGQTRDDETGTCSNNKCTDYTNCDENQYCEFDCGNSKPASGTCKDISKKTESLGKYISSTSGMSFWSAVDFCQANNMHLITASDMNCSFSSEDSTGKCCTSKGENMHNTNGKWICDDDSINEVITYAYSQFNPSYQFWTNETDGANSYRRCGITQDFWFYSFSLTGYACNYYDALCAE